MNRNLRGILLGLFWFFAGQVSAQGNLIPVDSLGLRDFLILQDKVPGLSYRFQIGDKVISDSLFLILSYLLSPGLSCFFWWLRQV